ncbi:MAG: methionine--tRNA ligase subunit beta [Candidatus Pacebacteria bacterium]|nr:methionine--tRNA ligase subunit beta [Candidatus Paceibacterota bacterium]
MITIDDFKKVELKVGRVLSAELVEGSEKLLKLQVNLGSEQRQILSGIAKFYQPADLVGRQIVVISNLESRMMMGLESNGMVLATHTKSEDGEALSLVTLDKEMPAGTTLS